MKIGVLTVSFNDYELLKANVKQFKNFNFLHVVVFSTTPWHGNEEWDANIAEGDNVKNLVGIFNSDAEQRNYGLQWMQRRGIDWTLVVDSDEYWQEKEIKKLLEEINKNNNSMDAITAPNMHVYWKNMDWRIYPDPQPDNPVVAMRTSERFRWSRLCDRVGQRRMHSEAEFHHLSYVRNDEQMRKKMEVSEHSHEIVPNWYEDVWLANRYENLHPVIPQQFAGILNKPVPQEIKELF